MEDPAACSNKPVFLVNKEIKATRLAPDTYVWHAARLLVSQARPNQPQRGALSDLLEQTILVNNVKDI